MRDYYCLISIANDRICSICGASFRNLPFLPGKEGGEDFSGKMETVVTSSRCAPKQIHVYMCAHDVYSDFGGADDTAKAETLPKSDRGTVLIFHSEDCLSY